MSAVIEGPVIGSWASLAVFHDANVLITQTVVAELVNGVGMSRSQGLPRYMLYGAFTA